MSQAPARPASVRWISIGAFSIWGLLFATTYGYLPELRYAWGFNLLRYQPDWAAWLLTGVALLFTTEELRRGVLRASAWSAHRLRSLPPRWRDLAIFAAALALLWTAHERVLNGNSALLQLVLLQDPVRLYPEPGGLFMLRMLFELAVRAHAGPVPTVQAIHCLAGAVTVLFVVRAARLAVPAGRGAGVVTALVFSGGLAAALAGRFEVHALALAASSASLWLGLRYLREGTGFAGAAATAGLAAWLQPLCLFALPALLLLPRLSGRKLTPAAILAVVPVGVWAVYLIAVDPKGVPAGEVVARVLTGVEGWVRGWGGYRSVGTDYVFLSPAHLKYLVNAAFVLAPAAVPIAIGTAIRARRLPRSPEIRFVAMAVAGLVSGALLTRPAWGPFDWDLFAVAALWTAFLAGVLLARVDALPVREHIAAAAIGLQLCFVGVPLLLIGQGPSVDAGPFAPGHFDVRLQLRAKGAPPALRPWL